MTLDRSAWPPGPWDDEPDSVSWVSAVGLQCEMRRGGLGVWCGYVGTHQDHPVWRLKDVESAFDVHGGVTLAGGLREDAYNPPIPLDFEWVGFDCCHAMDSYPDTARFIPPSMLAGWQSHYRDLAYVRAQCESLAAQIDAVALLEQAGFDVAKAPEWATGYARRFHVPRNERLAMLRRLASDPVAAQSAEGLGVR